MPHRGSRESDLLLTALEEAFHRRSWHGTNLLGSVRGLTPGQAAWRPAPGRHNIWEIIVHTAYWKYAVTRRITGAKRGGFPQKGSNWFPRPLRGTAAELAADIALLKRCHGELLAVTRAISPRDLRRRARASRFTVEAMVRGVAAHDLYHAGQIQLLKRLQAGD
jgi:hypothetical protein